MDMSIKHHLAEIVLISLRFLQIYKWEMGALGLRCLIDLCSDFCTGIKKASAL